LPGGSVIEAVLIILGAGRDDRQHYCPISERGWCLYQRCDRDGTWID
jgi:hypothetical protein